MKGAGTILDVAAVLWWWWKGAGLIFEVAAVLWWLPSCGGGGRELVSFLR